MDGPMRLLSCSWLVLLCALPGGGDDGLDAGFASITEQDLLVHATELASPQLEGRDSPSKGLYCAGEYIIGRLKAAGVEPGGTNQAYRMGYTLRRPAPVPDQCLLAFQPKDGEETVLVLEEDYVPFASCPGEAEGTLSFNGFGITESDEKKYDD